MIDTNPASNIPLASTPSDFNRERFLTTTELRQVLDAAERLENPARAFLSYWFSAVSGAAKHR
jgi:hypothetical protein